MVQLTSRDRVDAFWSSTLGVETAELHSPGVRAFPHPPQRAEWRGVYVLGFEKAASVFAPDELLERVGAEAVGADAEAMLEPATWQAMLGGVVRSAVGPVVHHYRDDPDGLAELTAGRRLNPDDAAALGDLRTQVSSQEWVAAGFSSHPAVMFGIFEDRLLVGAANLTAGPDAATDVGIVLRPDARGKGYGAQLVAVAARQALVMHGIARFRVLAASQPSLAIAQRLGFEEYGRNLAAYLAPLAQTGPPAGPAD